MAMFHFRLKSDKKTNGTNGLDSKRLTAHSLRRSAITIMLWNGVALTDVQQCARHCQLTTTMIYNDAVNRMKNTAEQTAANSIFATISA